MQQKGRLPRKTLYIWLLRYLIVFLLVLLPLIFLKEYKIILLTAVIAGIVLIYLLFFLKGYKIIIVNKNLLIEYGIIFKITYIIPFDKIVYINTFKTPVLKALGLSGVSLKTVKGILLLPENTEEFIRKLNQICFL